jgi:hypothetical protein
VTWSPERFHDRRASSEDYIRPAWQSDNELSNTGRGICGEKLGATVVAAFHRGLNEAGYIDGRNRGLIKYSDHTFHKTSVYKQKSRNHLLDQIEGFRMGPKGIANARRTCWTPSAMVSQFCTTRSRGSPRLSSRFEISRLLWRDWLHLTQWGKRNVADGSIGDVARPTPHIRYTPKADIGCQHRHVG